VDGHERNGAVNNDNGDMGGLPVLRLTTKQWTDAVRFLACDATMRAMVGKVSQELKTIIDAQADVTRQKGNDAMSDAKKTGIYVIQESGWDPYLIEILEGPADQDVGDLFDLFLDETGYTGKPLGLGDYLGERRDAFIEWLGQRAGWRVVDYDSIYIGGK
jgi:hypothetical protein